MTADPYARLGAAYLFGALVVDERLAFETHLASCERCRASLAEIASIPTMLAGLDEAAFAAPRQPAATPVPGPLLARLLQAAGRKRARRRRLTTGLALLAAACAIALIVIVLPSGRGGPNLGPRAMAALVATPVHATIALQPRSWGTEIDLTCWYPRGATEHPRDRYDLVAHGPGGATFELGSWRLAPGRRVIFSSGTALTESQIKDLQITEPDGRPILGLRLPGR
jgi:Putative zinc-finger